MFNSPILDPTCLERIGGDAAALAVSGGSDSVALLRLAKAAGLNIKAVLSVDHGLRPEAKRECEFVAEIAQQLALPHHVLSIHVPAQGNLMAEARRARYQALKTHCQSHAIPHLLLGHNADDLAETMMMNIFRGSGVDGLAVMPAVRGEAPILHRPLLAARRGELRQYLQAIGQKWMEDPSNDDTRFERVRMRAWLAEGEAQGFDFAGMMCTHQNFVRAQSALEAEARQSIREIVRIMPYGVQANIDRARFLSLHSEIALRVLSRLIQHFGRNAYPPRLSALMGLHEAIIAGEGRRSIGRAIVSFGEKTIRICAEPKFLPPPTAERVWNGYKFHGAFKSGWKIGARGHAKSIPCFGREAGLMIWAVQSLPAVYDGDKYLASALDPKLQNFGKFEELLPFF